MYILHSTIPLHISQTSTMNSLINDVTVKLVMSLIDDSSRPKTYISDKAKAPNNLTRRS